MEIFHTFVAKKLFLAKRGMPAIMPTTYLSTKVTSPSENAWNKLTDLLRFLRNSKEVILRLSMENNFIVKLYLDA
jgi:hypothetical protein